MFTETKINSSSLQYIWLEIKTYVDVDNASFIINKDIIHFFGRTLLHDIYKWQTGYIAK
jgi:hypothetical protein